MLRLKKVSKIIEKNPYLESISYVVIGVGLAIAFYQILGLALNTSDPIVTVMSGSMVPTLEIGDLVVLKGINNISDIKFGESVGRQNATILVYWHPQLDRLIIHRSWHLNDNGTIVTWGDAVSEADKLNVERAWIKGEAVFRIPFLGWPRVVIGWLIGR